MSRADTPQSILRRSMTESARLTKSIRRILEKQIESVEKAMDDPMIPESTKVDMVEHMILIMQALERSVESAGRLLVTKPTKPEGDGVPKRTPEEIMNELTKGKKV